jgi:tRNA (guanine-N7-)-methyltransferase
LAPNQPIDGTDIGAAGDTRRPPRFYGRRKGKPLRKGKQELVEELLPRLSIPVPGAGEKIDPLALFENKPQEVWLEVGFGGGEHTAAQADANPGVGLIGSEVFLNGLGGLLKHIAANAIGNIRIFPEDVRLLLPSLPDGCLSKVFVLFPDPWPKKRHAERRFIGQANLDQLARLLRSGGELRIASDHPVYIDWALEQMGQRKDFANILKTNEHPADWPVSRYEQKALAKGVSCTYTAWKRK